MQNFLSANHDGWHFLRLSATLKKFSSYAPGAASPMMKMVQKDQENSAYTILL